jgi:hypothetical protein
MQSVTRYRYEDLEVILLRWIHVETTPIVGADDARILLTHTIYLCIWALCAVTLAGVGGGPSLSHFLRQYIDHAFRLRILSICSFQSFTAVSSVYFTVIVHWSRQEK